MHVHCILLREINSYRTVSSLRVARQFIIEAIVTRKHILIDFICIDDIPISLTNTGLTIIIQTVTDKFFTFIGQN